MPPSLRTRPRLAAARRETSSRLEASAPSPSDAGVATPEGGTENLGINGSPGAGDALRDDLLAALFGYVMNSVTMYI